MGGEKTRELDFMEDVGDKLKKKKGAKRKLCSSSFGEINHETQFIELITPDIIDIITIA